MKKNVLIFILLAAATASCGFFDVSASDKRDKVPQSIVLSPDVVVTPIGAIKFFGMDFLSPGFKIVANGKTIYIDPVMTGDTNSADYIFITHEHMDHLSVKDIRKLMKDDTLIVCTKTTVAELSGLPVKEVKPGDSIKFDGFECEVVPAYTTRPVFLGVITHPKEDGKAGYVLTFGDIRIYHMGDTEFIPEMKSLSNITVALVPVFFCMNPEEAAHAVNTIMPKIAAPMHYILGSGDAKKFAELVDKSIEVKFLTTEE